jgi:RNA polymerase sigma-B factor
MTPKRPGSAPGSADPRQLFIRWQRQGDSAAREALVQRYMPLARSLTRRYGRSSEPFEDLLQVASMGLLTGNVDRPARVAEVAAHQERALKVRDARERLANEKGHAPTVGELAQYLEFDSEDVLDALQAIQAYETVSLDAPRPGSAEGAAAYGDSIGSDDERYELVELDATLSAVLGHIPERERLILKMRYVEDLTQTEIAERVGISQMQVSRLLRRSLDQLRSLTHAPASAG